jgi:hypothetical protein
MFFQAVIVTAATLTAAPQQTDQADRQSPAAAVGIVQADAGVIVAPSVELLGPRPAPLIWAPAPAPTLIDVSRPSAAMPPEGDQVVVISTLSLVLAVVILVLLIK